MKPVKKQAHLKKVSVTKQNLGDPEFHKSALGQMMMSEQGRKNLRRLGVDVKIHEARKTGHNIFNF